MNLPYLLASRLRDVPADVVIPPEIKRALCSSGCGAVILLAPSSAALIDAGEAVPVCCDCLPKSEAYVGMFPPGGAEEARRYNEQMGRVP